MLSVAFVYVWSVFSGKEVSTLAIFCFLVAFFTLNSLINKQTRIYGYGGNSFSFITWKMKLWWKFFSVVAWKIESIVVFFFQKAKRAYSFIREFRVCSFCACITIESFQQKVKARDWLQGMNLIWKIHT